LSALFSFSRNSHIFLPIISNDKITEARSLTLSANSACYQNHSLAPIMLGGGRVALMPLNGNQPNAIKQFIQAGADLYARIQNGDFENFHPGANPPIVGETELSQLMWYLQALAASKASASAGGTPVTPKEFKAGGMLINDPDGKLKRFLDLANSYPRPSDHFPQYQSQEGCQARAIDVFNEVAPYGARSLLYQKLPEGEPSRGAKLLYVKLEPYGYRGLSTKETGYSAMIPCHDPQLSSKPGFFGALKRFFTNLHQTLARIFSRNPDKAAIRGGLDNLERVPNWLASDYRQFLASLKTRFRAEENFKKAIDQVENYSNNPLKVGVAKILRTLEYLKINVSAKLRHVDDRREFLASLEQFKNQVLVNVGDHPDFRFGREVILTENEMDILAPQIADNLFFSFNPSSLALNIEDRSIIENIQTHVNDALNAQGVTQQRLIEATNEDFLQGHANLNVFTDSEEEENRWHPPLFDSSPILADSTEVRALTERLDKKLKRVCSQQFSDAVRSLINHEGLADLIALTNYYLATQTGATIEELGLSLDLDYTLTRLPLNREGIAADGLDAPISYALEARGRSKPGLAADGRLSPRIEGKIEPRISFILEYEPRSNQTRARVNQVSVNYDISRTRSYTLF
jgi:hypothetical protein